MEGTRRGELAPFLGVYLDPFGTNVCVKHLQEGSHTLSWDPLTPYLVPQGFSRWRKPVEADFPGAEGTGIGIQRCTQAAFWGLGDLAQASHRGDTIHQLCRQERSHQRQSCPLGERRTCASLSTALPCCDKSIIYVIDPLDDSFPCPATGSTTHHSWQVLPVPYFYGFSLKFPRIKELRIPSVSSTEGDDPPSPRPLTIPTRASRGGPKSTSRSWRNLAAAFWARMELRAPHRGGLVRGGGPTAPAATVTAWLPAPTWVGDGHRGLRVAADLGAVLGVEEVDGKLLELAAVEEGVYLCQLQQGHLHLLSGLPRLEDQFTLREDVVLEEKEEVCPR